MSNGNKLNGSEKLHDVYNLFETLSTQTANVFFTNKSEVYIVKSTALVTW